MDPSPRHRRRVAFTTLAIVAVSTILTIAARHLDPIPEGLRVQYFSNADPAAGPELSAVDLEPDTEDLFADWSGRAPQSFTAVWSGWLVAPRDGTYAIVVNADQAAAVEIDGRVLVESRGGGRDARSAPVALRHGSHSVFMRYVHTDGLPAVALEWSRSDAPLEPVPAWALRTRQISYRRFVMDRALDAGEVASGLALLLTFVWTVGVAWGPAITSARVRWLGSAWPALACILAVSTLLNVAGIGWGLPGGDWVGDELGPFFVLDAVAHRFARGWFTIYPPFHYYVLGIAYTPVFALEWLGVIKLQTTVAHGLMALSGRLVSVVMAAGMIVATFELGRRTFGQRAALMASAMLALAAPFVYYAKTANVEVPYLFWLSLSLVFYLQILTGASIRAYVCWAATAALAMCTKDQAYAFCAGMVLVVLFETWRRKAFDRRIVAAALTGITVCVLAENLPFNLSGFLQHVDYATVRRVTSYAMFEPTLRGRLSLLGLTIHLVEQTWGWPVFLLSIVGAVWAIAAPEHRRVSVWLLVPAVSYYLGFTNLVLYNYDRFVLPLCLVLVQFGGFAMDRLTADCTSFRPLRLAAAGALLAYTLLYAATVDALMLRDSRYGVEQWLAGRVRPGDVVGTTGIARYLPRLDSMPTVDIDRLQRLTEAQPRFCLVNADYTRSEAPDSRLGEVLDALRNGRTSYRLVVEARSPSPWPWLPGAHADLVGPRLDHNSTSFLRNINPTIEIFERR